MKKAAGVFFLLNLFALNFAFAQEQPMPQVASGYEASKVLDNLKNSTFFTFDFAGNFIVDEPMAHKTQLAKVSPDGSETIVLDHTQEPITGLSFHNGVIYVIFRGRISVVRRGKLSDVVSGLPTSGDYANSPVIFENDKMYFSVGTATNSGVVGTDNSWLAAQPSVHDLLCRAVPVTATEFNSDNTLTSKKGDFASTGAFQPFNTPNFASTTVPSEKCNGAIFSAGPDGSNLKLVSDGLHNPKGLSFDAKGDLYAFDSAMENRGARPVPDGLDAVYKIRTGDWYGWPDYDAGIPVGAPLISALPNPVPQPVTTFPAGILNQFTLNQFISNSGLALNGKKISEFGLTANSLNEFFVPQEGFRVAQFKFGPDKNLYVLVNNGKISQVWKIQQIRSAAAVAGSIMPARSLPMAWSISLAFTAIGLLAAYLVFKNQQRTVF